MRRAGLVGIGMALALMAGGAAALDFPLPAQVETVEGVQVVFTGALSAEPSADCGLVEITARIDLSDLARKALQIMRTAGVERSQSCGDSVALSSVDLWAEGPNLGVKVNGSVARQECVKTKVPEFRGLKMTMKERVIASNTFRTNASLRGVFDPVVEDGRRLRARRVSGPTLAVSNDIYRNLLGMFDLKGMLTGKLERSVDAALGDSGAALVLPPHLTELKLAVTDARMDPAAKGLVLVLDGNAPLPDTVRMVLALSYPQCR